MATTTASPDFLDVFAARREHLRRTAPCVSCGTSWEECEQLKANNSDPTAPNWFGCCAVGPDLQRCRHLTDPHAQRKLLDEVASGTLRTVEEAYPPPPPPVQSPDRAPMSWLLAQTEWWRPERGPMLRLADMTDTHRLHLTRWLNRRAAALATVEWFRVLGQAPGGDAPDVVVALWEAEMDELKARPQAWLHRTPLYRAITESLPSPVDDPERWTDLLERSAHWSTCPANRDLAASPSCSCKASTLSTFRFVGFVDYDGDAAGTNGL